MHDDAAENIKNPYQTMNIEYTFIHASVCVLVIRVDIWLIYKKIVDQISIVDIDL